MTYNDCVSYITWRAALLMAGRLDDLARHCEVPLEIDLAGRNLVLTSREDVLLHLHRTRLAFLARSFAKLDPHVCAVELPGATQRVWVRWNALDGCGAVLAQAESVYLLVRSGGGPRVKSVRNPTLLVPEIASPQFRNRLIRSRA
ncbi:hypothetical protein GC209_10000 [bacterium]|nr:hypothetical protein [bacterium]